MFEYILNFDSLDLSPETVFREMGYDKVKPGKEVSDIVHSIFEDITTITHPSCTFRLMEGETDATTVVLEKTTTLNVGNVIAKMLKEANRFAIFAATAGISFQQYQDRTKEEGDILRNFILDVTGSCIAERTGDKMESLLEKEITGCSHTYRFSPGYCNWSLKEQKKIFFILGNQPCGITLSDVSLMHPIKSISGIIGIGSNVHKKKYGCDICQLKTCYKKKE